MSKYIATTEFSIRGKNVGKGMILEKGTLGLTPADINMLVRLGRVVETVPSPDRHITEETSIGTRFAYASNENFYRPQDDLKEFKDNLKKKFGEPPAKGKVVKRAKPEVAEKKVEKKEPVKAAPKEEPKVEPKAEPKVEPKKEPVTPEPVVETKPAAEEVVEELEDEVTDAEDLEDEEEDGETVDESNPEKRSKKKRKKNKNHAEA